MLEYLLFVVFDIKGHRVDFGAVEPFRKLVEDVGVRVGVAELELFVGEFTID